MQLDKHFKQYVWYNGIATACLQPVLKGIRRVARPDTCPRTHPRQTVARWTLTRKKVALPDSSATGQ